MFGSTLGRLPCVLAAVALIGGSAASAVAAESAPRIDPSVKFDNQISLVLSGRIERHCELSGGGDIHFGELRGGLTRSAALGLDCNAPFDLTLSSARGGLAHETLPGGQGPFAGTLSYHVRISAPVLRPKRDVITAEFSSEELRGKGTLSSGDAIAAGGAELHFRTGRLPAEGMLAGAYSETLTVTVTARM